MTERSINTAFWTDPFVQECPKDAKILFLYLKTNGHCNPAGLYVISPTTIAFETGLPLGEIPGLLKSLSPQVEWYPETKCVWVKDFLREQAKSPKFIVAAIKSLSNGRLPEELRNAFEEYNDDLLHGVAPSEHASPTKRECVIIRDNFLCQYCGVEIINASDYEVDHIIPVARGGKENYLNLVAACHTCNQRKLDKTPYEAGLPSPTPTPFHGAQATYILRTNPSIRKKWLSLFPNRYRVVESMLDNIDQYCSTLTPDTHARADSTSATNTSAKADTVAVEKEVSAERGKRPQSEGEKEESLSEGDHEIISIWCSVKGFDLSEVDAAALVAKLRSEFPDIDILAESKAWTARKISEPITRKSRPSGQLWNWMKKAREFAKQQGGTYAGRQQFSKAGGGAAGSRPPTDKERKDSIDKALR